MQKMVRDRQEVGRSRKEVMKNRKEVVRGRKDPGILQARTLEWVAISFSNA